MRIILVVASILLLSIASFSQEKQKKVEYLPEEHYFEPLILDPVECQSNAGLYAYWQGSDLQNMIYSPLALGFQLPVVQWDKGNYGFEIGFMAAIFFQFEFVDPTYYFQVILINTDLKVGLPFVFRYNRFSMRTSIIHQSSHFSEEYIFYNGLKTFGENRNTYDAIEIQASWQFEHMRYYGGVEMAFNSPYNRGFWKFQGGIMYRHPVREGSKFNYLAGTNLQILQETSWSLNTIIGAGIEIAYRAGRKFQIMAQYYNGNLPYSQYTQLKVQYLGASLIGHPF